MVEFTIELMLDIIRTSGILVGIFYYLTILRNQQKNRMIDLVFRRMQSDGAEYQRMARMVEPQRTGWNTVEEFYQKYGYSTSPEDTIARNEIIRKLKSWGFLLKEGAVDLDFITRIHSPWYIIRIWEGFSPIIFDGREKMGNPEHHIDFEYLYDEVKKKYPHISADTVMFEKAYV